MRMEMGIKPIQWQCKSMAWGQTFLEGKVLLDFFVHSIHNENNSLIDKENIDILLIIFFLFMEHHTNKI